MLSLVNGCKLPVVTPTRRAIAVFAKHIRPGWQQAGVVVHCANLAGTLFG
jgi:hypothetical protein